MKKYLILLISFSIFYNISSAQQKAKKKPTTKPTQKLVVPKVNKTNDKEILPPPIPSYGGNYPTVSISPEMSNYYNKINCSDCDTLVLEICKPQIVIYDITRMLGYETPTFYEQPKEGELKGLTKREWDELQKNYLDADVKYHFVFRNTYIVIPNSSKQNINLLNREDFHKGFLYWSGNKEDTVLKSHKMVLTTEQIAKVRGENKISSYYESFKQDSLQIESLLKTSSVDKNVAELMNSFLLDRLFRDFKLPIQFWELNKVQKIKFNVEGKNGISISFNAKKQISAVNFDDDENYVIGYENDLPTTVTKNNKPYFKISYQNNLIIVKDNNQVNVYQLVGKLFLNTKQYYTENDNYEKLEINSPVNWKMETENGNLCCYMTRTDDKSIYSWCYSNNNWQLPLTIESEFNGYPETTIFKINNNNELEMESQNSYKSTKILYTIENGKLIGFKYFKKRANEEYQEDAKVKVEYEYYQ